MASGTYTFEEQALLACDAGTVARGSTGSLAIKKRTKTCRQPADNHSAVP